VIGGAAKGGEAWGRCAKGKLRDCVGGGGGTWFKRKSVHLASIGKERHWEKTRRPFLKRESGGDKLFLRFRVERSTSRETGTAKRSRENVPILALLGEL